MRILLADSDEAFSKSFADVVRRLGGETRLARSAGEAYSALASFRPDVVVASRDLPADGPRDLASLLADGPFSSIPTILLVAAGAGVVSVAGDVIAVTLQRPVRPERLATICDSVRRIRRVPVPALGRNLASKFARSTGVECGFFMFGD